MLVMNTLLFYLPWMVKTNVGVMFLYLTLFSVQLTEYSLITSIWSSQYEYGVTSLIDYKVLAMLINTIAQSVNVMVTVVSWIFILPFIWTMDDGWSTP